MSCDVSSLILEGERSSRSDSKQAQGAVAKIIQHCYNNVGIVVGLCWRCFSFLGFLNSTFIHRFWVYSCIYHFNRFSFVDFSFICDACGVTPLFPRNFCSTLILLAVAWIDNLTISFDINNDSVFTFTMVTISFGLTRDLMLFAISLAMISCITSKSLINKIWICIFHDTHFSITTKLFLQNQIFFFIWICLFYLPFVQSSNQISLIRFFFSFCVFAPDL